MIKILSSRLWLIIFPIIIIVIVIYFVNSNGEKSDRLKQLNDSIAQLQNQNASYVQCIFNNEICGGREFRTSENLKTIEGRVLESMDTLFSNTKLVLRYTEFGCSACIEDQVQRLVKLAEKIGRDHVIIITYYNLIRDLVAFQRINKINFPVFILPRKSIILPIEEIDVPYFFILNGSNRIFSFFQPTKANPELTDKYFEIIQKRYFRQMRTQQ